MVMAYCLASLELNETREDTKRGATAPKAILASWEAARNTCRGRTQTHPFRAFIQVLLVLVFAATGP